MLQLFIMFFSLVLCTSSLFANEEVWGYKKKEMAQVADTVTEQEAKKEEEENADIEAYEESKEQEVVRKQAEKAEEELKPDYVSVPVLKENMRVGTLITEDDVTMSEVSVKSLKDTTIMNIEEVIGKQVRRSCAKNSPLNSESLGMPILVKRNQNVDIIFQKGSLLLSTNGRALDQGGIGERIKVMNLESKKVVTGKVTAQGDIDVAL